MKSALSRESHASNNNNFSVCGATKDQVKIRREGLKDLARNLLHRTANRNLQVRL
jgi:hypothetical protein